jgi:RTX calcium-binding nonapeptide repeat (4 copies)
MNICQISSQDLLHCLVPGRLSEMPFFQQVLAIAEDEHLVSVSDYAIGQFLEARLPATDQRQLEALLEVIDVWQTDAADYDRAIALSHKQQISIADAIDTLIYDNLCPDWLLVAETTRNLPNATGIASFWQEWIDIRDDLPPSGGGSLIPRPTGGGGPSGSSQNYDRSTSADATNANTSQVAAFNSSVLFSQSYVSADWVSDGQPTQGKAVIALGENQPSAAAIGLMQSLQAALPNLQIRLEPVGSGWSVVIEQPSGQTVKTLSLAELAGDRATMLSAALSQIQAARPELIGNALNNAMTSGRSETIAQAVQSVQGTTQNDVIYVSQANPGAPIDGGAGVDLVSYREATSGVTVDLSVNQPLQNVENLEGSEFSDRLTGDRNDNVIIGRAGNDTLIGNAGNDIIKGGGGNNVLVGGAPIGPTPILPSPTLAQPPGTGIAPPPLIPPGIKPGIKPGVITSTSGTGFTPMPGAVTSVVTDDGSDMAGPLPAIRDDDWIFAGSGDDVINAGEGNNFISAGTGNNTIASGSGQDLFVLESGPGVTRILQYQSHDKFGLLGGYHYDDLVITAAKTTENATQIRLKSATGDGDLLAIVVGVTPNQLDRSTFLKVQYDQPDSKDTANGLTQVIPDWLMASQREGHTLHVPTLSQLAPTLRALPTFDVPRAS